MKNKDMHHTPRHEVDSALVLLDEWWLSEQVWLYCQDKNVCGYSAVKTGLFPSIKDARTINKQLDEPTFPSKSKQSDCKILSNTQEQALIRFLKNKSCSMQGDTHAKATTFVYDILHE